MFTRVHFSGGGFAVLGYIGFLYYLEISRNNELVSNYRLTGTSAGAIIAFLVYIGYKSNEMMTELFDKIHEFHTFVKRCDIIEYERSGELLDLSGLWSWLNTLSLAKGYDIYTTTFVELYKTRYKRYLGITGTSIKNGAVMFDHETSPDMTIVQALRITTCIPFCFKPIQYDSDFFLDGGLSDNKTDDPNTLIVMNNTTIDSKCFTNDEFDLLMYMSSVYDTVVCVLTNEKFIDSKNKITVKSSCFLSCDGIDENTLLGTMVEGYELTRDFFKKRC